MSMGNQDATYSDFMYDVFLMSFSEERSCTFTDYLYQALLDDGIKTIRYSNDQTVTHSLEESRMSMVVLCENYAYSARFLDVLVKIIESYDEQGKQISIIFYKVKPSDVWLQENSYAEAMIQHDNNFGEDSDRLKAWRSALARIRDIGGEYCTDDKYESGFIKKVVKSTSAKLPPPPVPLETKHLVGLDSRFEEVKSILDIESNDAACMLGIHGDAGIGKTTLAAYLYNKIKHQFEAASFLSNISKKSNNGNSINALEDLQKTLLYETVKETTQTMMMGNAFEGQSQIKCKLSHKRVLLLLDDVDAIEQLEALCGGCDWFGSGSRIIVTTRDETVLDKHKVTIKKYNMEELNSSDSLELFCLYAFDMRKPEEQYEDISNDVVSYAQGSPRALKVLGSHLKGLSLKEWKIELKKFRKVPNAFSFLVDSF